MNYTDDERYITATVAEKKWIDAYAISKDISEATRAAYQVKEEKDIRAYGLTVLGRPRIAGLVKEYFSPRIVPDLPTSDQLRELYMELFNSPNSTIREKLQALTAYERVSGFSKPKPTKDDEFNPLDDILD